MVNPVVRFSFKAILVAADIFLLILDRWALNVKGPLLYLPMSHQMFGIADLDHLRISRKKKTNKKSKNCFPHSQTKAREVVLSYSV